MTILHLVTEYVKRLTIGLGTSPVHCPCDGPNSIHILKQGPILPHKNTTRPNGHS